VTAEEERRRCAPLQRASQAAAAGLPVPPSPREPGGVAVVRVHGTDWHPDWLTFDCETDLKRKRTTV